jgi:hypothetical protein
MQYLCLLNKFISSIDAFSICRDLASLNIVLLSIQSSFPREKFTDTDIQAFQENLKKEIQQVASLTEKTKSEVRDADNSKIEQLCSDFNNPQSLLVVPFFKWKGYPRPILIGCILFYILFLALSHYEQIWPIWFIIGGCVCSFLGVFILWQIIKRGFPKKKSVEDKIHAVINRYTSLDQHIKGLNP